MTMRISKYIEFVLSLLVFTIWFIYFTIVEENASLISIVILISTDLIIKLGFKIYSNKLLSLGTIVKISQKESRWNQILNITSLIAIIVFACYIFIDLEFSFSNNPEIILLLYIGLSSHLFLDKKGDFYIDKMGLIQPEILKKNYNWDEIDDFHLTNNAVSFIINSKDYVVDITDETKTKITELTNPIDKKSA